MDDSPLPGDRVFELELPALVQGTDVSARDFVEQTAVASLCAGEAVLRLKSKVGPGTKLRLSLRIPSTFLLEKPLDLNLTGIVSHGPEEGEGGRGGAIIRVRLDRGYRILPVSA
jgi:hypothetical protein